MVIKAGCLDAVYTDGICYDATKEKKLTDLGIQNIICSC
jgi:hypothetical protein